METLTAARVRMRMLGMRTLWFTEGGAYYKTGHLDTCAKILSASRGKSHLLTGLPGTVDMQYASLTEFIAFLNLHQLSPSYDRR